MTRNEILLREANHSTKILEIGPGYNPVAPKSEGWNTHVIDHASADELRAKYTGAPVDVERLRMLTLFGQTARSMRRWDRHFRHRLNW